VEEMATMKRSKLLSVEALPGYWLRLTFITNTAFTVSLADDLDK
jgi:hypothetical protein